jgi:hypothetical protein
MAHFGTPGSTRFQIEILILLGLFWVLARVRRIIVRARA